SSTLSTLSLHDALPISLLVEAAVAGRDAIGTDIDPLAIFVSRAKTNRHDTAKLRERIRPVLASIESISQREPRQAQHLLTDIDRSEEHTSELQSLAYLV